VSSVDRVGIVGCGLMGAGIAEVCARAGMDVVVAESSTRAGDAGRKRLETSLVRAEKRGRLDRAADVLDRIRVVHGLDDLADRELVVEAIMEDEGAKMRSWPRTPPRSRS
jgi:3-hydroxybutyryl-CoA dehydrogenase